jgi:hypothetical protein
VPDARFNEIPMMNRRHSLFLLLIILVAACNRGDSQNESIDETATGILDEETQLFEKQAYKDSVLLATSAEVLTIIKAKDYRKLTDYFHPEEGVRFSPYGYIDTVHHVHFTSQEFIEQLEDEESISWGSYDGTGKDIQMSLAAYFEKFVYEVDFLNAEQFSVNEVLGTGNSLINIHQVYPGADFTESYFSGFEEKYGGMDWRSLRLIFRQVDGKPRLVGVVHDQWTI